MCLPDSASGIPGSRCQQINLDVDLRFILSSIKLQAASKFFFLKVLYVSNLQIGNVNDTQK